ncbi:MAG: hypothetical protein V1929_13365 [bacterium]
MGYGFLVIGFFLFAAPAAPAQITVNCRIDPATAAQYEDVSSIITIGNNTGTELELFTTNALCDVVLEVRDQDNVDLTLTSAHFMARPVRLAASVSLTVTNNLLDFFDLRKVGSYKVYGKALWNGKAYISERAFLDIVPGMEIQRIEAGLPAGGGRQYTLRTLNRDRFDRLLMRIDDDEGGSATGCSTWADGSTPRRRNSRSTGRETSTCCINRIRRSLCTARFRLSGRLWRKRRIPNPAAECAWRARRGARSRWSGRRLLRRRGRRTEDGGQKTDDRSVDATSVLCPLGRGF